MGDPVSIPVPVPVQKSIFDPQGSGVFCPGCGEEIDPEVCHCGDFIKDHSNPMNDGHSPIPMGCTCGYYRKH